MFTAPHRPEAYWVPCRSTRPEDSAGTDYGHDCELEYRDWSEYVGEGTVARFRLAGLDADRQDWRLDVRA